MRISQMYTKKNVLFKIDFLNFIALNEVIHEKIDCTHLKPYIKAM
jgi:hypothetical protein